MPSSAPARALTAPCLALVLAAAAAIAWQDFGGALPLGLFNEGRELYHWLSRGALALALLAAAIFGVELARGRGIVAGSTARGVLVSLVMLELFVTGLDVAFVSRTSGIGAGLGGPYREATSRSGTRVVLKQPHAGSPLGLRTAQPHAKRPEKRRLLFLGDSYTEGSGRDAVCNYPEVATAALNEVLAKRGEPPYEAMNAGVAGYGPEESLALLHFLRDEAYVIDAIVLSLFVENDFSDDLPGTERRVVAGINFRFPRSPWLRWLHPLNTRTARYAMFLWQASQLGRADDAVQRGDGDCRPPPPLPDPLPEDLRKLVLRRYASNYGPDPQVARESVAAALRAIRLEAEALGVPFVVVVFPDRIVADRELRARLGVSLDAEWQSAFGTLRRLIVVAADGAPVVDATDALSGGSVNYRASDTHLSDVGNQVAGRFVGGELAAILAGDAARGAR